MIIPASSGVRSTAAVTGQPGVGPSMALDLAPVHDYNIMSKRAEERQRVELKDRTGPPDRHLPLTIDQADGLALAFPTAPFLIGRRCGVAAFHRHARARRTMSPPDVGSQSEWILFKRQLASLWREDNHENLSDQLHS